MTHDTLDLSAFRAIYSDAISRDAMIDSSFVVLPVFKDNKFGAEALIQTADGYVRIVVGLHGLGKVHIEPVTNMESYSASGIAATSADLARFEPNMPGVAEKFREDMTKGVQSTFIFPSSSGVLDRDAAIAALSFIELEKGVDVIGKLDETIRAYQALQARRRTAPTAPSAHKVAPGAYRAELKARVARDNKTLRSVLRSITFDADNPIQAEISRGLYMGKSSILLGDTGIGKTYNPALIAEANGFGCEIINLHAQSDAAELIGGPTLGRANFYSEGQSIFFDPGLLAEALGKAAERFKESGVPTIVVLDELYRVEDMTSFISNLSINDHGEYSIKVKDRQEYACVKDAAGDHVWCLITDNIDASTQTYSIGNGAVQFKEKERLMAANFEEALERSFRGDLFTIFSKDAASISRGNIIATKSENKRIVVPMNAVAFVGTSNIGKYEINIPPDLAFNSRLRAVFQKSPSPAFMVDQTIKKAISNGFVEWSEATTKKTGRMLTTYFETIQNLIKQGTLKTDGAVNFRMVGDCVAGLDETDPFAATGFGNIQEVLTSITTGCLVNIDPSKSAEQHMSSSVCSMIADTVKDVLGGGLGRFSDPGGSRRTPQRNR